MPPSPSPPKLGRQHRTRLTSVWRSAGWPCHDNLEIDLLAAGLLARVDAGGGRETLRVTDAGIAWLSDARLRGRRADTPHDRLAARVVAMLQSSGRIVWQELSLRAQTEPEAAPPPAPSPGLWDDEVQAAERVRAAWRLARPDVFSVRNTTVESYLHPVIHEVKASRADLLSDLRHAAKRQAYQWLCCECYYVFPAGTATLDEIPEAFGVWVLHGDLAEGRLEQLRAARHTSCELPFAVWMALAKATPAAPCDDDGQGLLACGD